MESPETGSLPKDEQLSVLVFPFAVLLAGCPLDIVDILTDVPALMAEPTAPDQELGTQATSALAPESPPPPAESVPLAAPSASTRSSDVDQTDQSAIIVMAQPGGAAIDPLREVNAASFTAVQAVDKAFVGPVALAYQHVVPRPVRSGLRNFFGNLQEPVVFLNFILQIKPGKAAETIGRFAINSTIGVGGLIDVAKKRPFELPRHPNGFAYTMGYYGVKPGPYLFLPLIGPTTLRDVLGRGLDLLVLPSVVGKPFNQPAYSVTTTTVRSLDDRAESDERLLKLRDESADPYTAMRNDYMQTRQAEIDELRGKRTSAINPASAPISPATAAPPQAPILPDMSGQAPPKQMIGPDEPFLTTPDQSIPPPQ